MGRSMLIAILIVATLSVPGQAANFSRYRTNVNTKSGAKVVDNAIFRFLPSAISASDECTGNALTATKGTFTVTRASSATCTKSDGTIVTLIDNKPRLQGHGMVSESSATNKVPRSEEMENAAWAATNVTVAATDTVVAPDGTTSADTLTSTSNGGYLESTAFTAGTTGQGTSVYVKTTSGTQSVAMRLRDTSAGSDKCTTTVTANTAWQRVTCITASGLTTGNNHVVRLFPGGTGSTGTAVFWGAQDEAAPATSNALTSSYIKTTNVAVTRSGDQPQATSTGVNNFRTTAYFQATIWPPDGGNIGYVFRSDSGTGLSHAHLGSTGLTWQCNFIDTGSSPVVTSVATLTRGQENTVSCEYTPTSIIACVNGSCTTTSGITYVNMTGVTFGTFKVGYNTGTNTALKGMIRKLCISNTKADCL